MHAAKLTKTSSNMRQSTYEALKRLRNENPSNGTCEKKNCWWYQFINLLLKMQLT